MDRDYEPKDAMATFVSRYWEWGYRFIVLICVFGYWVGNSKASYATKDDVKAMFAPVSERVDHLAETMGSRIGSMETALAVLAEQNKINSRQDEMLRDLEIRLRAAERKP